MTFTTLKQCHLLSFRSASRVGFVRNIQWCINSGYVDMAISRPAGIGLINNPLKTTVYNFIYATLPTIVNQGHFDREHDRLLQDLIRIANHAHVNLTYGHAQKFVNMTLKYLYNEIAVGVLLGDPPIINHAADCRIFTTISDFFHMPIDSIVLEVIKKVPSNFANKIAQYNGTWKYTGPSGIPQSWSKMDRQTYLNFVYYLRRSLMPNIKPLEAEYHTWKCPNYLCLKGWIYI